MIADLRPYPAMKASGVPWLGKVPEHWEVRRLGSLGTFSASGIDKKTVEGEPTVRMVNYLDIFRNSTHTLNNDHDYMVVSCPAWKRSVHDVRTGDMIFTPSSETIEEIGCSAVAVQDIEDGVYSYHVVRFRPARSMALGFQKYWCNSAGVLGQFSAACKGTTRQILTRGDFRAISVAVPPLSEQRAIGRFLDRASRRIRRYIHAKQKLIKLLEEQKQTIIHGAVTRGLDPDVRLKPSGVEWLGDVPEHWEVRRLGRLAQVFNGTTPSRAEPGYWSRGTIPWLSSGKVNDFVIERASELVTERALHECSISLVPKGAIVIGLVGQGKTRAKSAILGIDACINQNMAAIIPRRELLEWYLLHSLTASYSVIRELGRGGNQEALNCEIIAQLRVLVPPKDEQVKIARYLNKAQKPITALIDITRREIGFLTEYRTRLIADVVTGKLDAREAAASLPDEADEPEPLDEADALADADDEMGVHAELEEVEV